MFGLMTSHGLFVFLLVVCTHVVRPRQNLAQFDMAQSCWVLCSPQNKQKVVFPAWLMWPGSNQELHELPYLGMERVMLAVFPGNLEQ